MNAAPNFDGLARIYRWLELATFGNALWRCRCAFLGELRGCRRALVLGDGDGRFTARLLEMNSEIQIDALDASPAMLRALLERAGSQSKRVRTWCGDIRAWQPNGATYDLVVSHFFLDCLTTDEVAELAARLRSCILPEARWLISEFAVPENAVGSMVARPLVGVLYRAFGWMTGLGVRRLPQYAEAILAKGFRRQLKQSFLGGILGTELWWAPPD